MTGGMAFVYDKSNEFEKKVNPESVIWQNVETEYWINFLKGMVLEHSKETGSLVSKNIITLLHLVCNQYLNLLEFF